MCESFRIVRFPSKKAFFRALLADYDDMVNRTVVFKVYCENNPKRIIHLGITINRLKRITNGKEGGNVWQFTGTLRTSDTYMFEGIERILGDTPRRYVGGEFSTVNKRVTWSPTSRNIIVLSHEEFTLFQR